MVLLSFYPQAHVAIVEYVQSPNIPKHSLRIKQTERLCDSVKQYSGYLDVKPGKHFFFWYFEARHDPENAPLVSHYSPST
jgi:carboxypeptidase C (cathepsin A)